MNVQAHAGIKPEPTSPLVGLVEPQGKTDIAVEQNLAVLLENGPGFSVLFARHISSEPDDGKAILEDCTHLRVFPDDRRSVEKFPEVAFGRDPNLPCFVASPDGGLTLFGQPSSDPYRVLQLSEEEADTIYAELEKSGKGGVFELLRCRFGEWPGFESPNPGEIHSPDTYANAQEAYSPTQPFL